jgi:hypothetical protein
VLRIRYGAVELLLTGDIGSDSEAHLPSPQPDALIRVLKVRASRVADLDIPDLRERVRAGPRACQRRTRQPLRPSVR